jgi:cell division protein FtsZ
MDGHMRVSVVATGIENEVCAQQPTNETAKLAKAVATERSTPPRAAATFAATRPSVTPRPQIEVAERVVAAAPVEAEPELPAFEVAERPAPRVGGFDPREYEAEVIIHKPEQRMQPQAAMRDEPVVRAADVLAEPKQRPFIPGDLERVQTAKDTPSFPGNRPVPVAQSRMPKRGPTFFERLTGGRRRTEEESVAAPAAPRREPVATREPARPQEASKPVTNAPSLTPSTESRLVQPSFEEEQLEIPTFLRRQAN